MDKPTIIAPCLLCNTPEPHSGEVTTFCSNSDCGFSLPTEMWNRLSRAINVFEAALAWQQAIATVNGVHTAEQRLLAALKEDT